MPSLPCVAVAIAATVSSMPAFAVDSVKMMIAALPGSGCDVAARELGKALVATGAAKSVQYQNQAGAGGAIGLAQFVNSSKGDPGALMVGGSAIITATLRNRSAVSLANVTPLARLAAPAKPPANGDLDGWCGVFAAPGITTAQRDELVKAAETATKTKEWQEALKKNEWEGRWLAADAYASFIDAEGKRISAALAR
jgi:tripartite-type tricarboxylate transporter receptor subunit TctC